jgi:hypothetical protein
LQSIESGLDLSGQGQGQGGEQGMKHLLASLMTDLTNFGSLVSALKHGNDPFAGAGTETRQVAGVGAFGNLDQGGKPDLKDLPKPDDHRH